MDYLKKLGVLEIEMKFKFLNLLGSKMFIVFEIVFEGDILKLKGFYRLFV